MTDAPRTWRFWLGWVVIRSSILVILYTWGWMSAFWFVCGALIPDFAWYIKDEECRLVRRQKSSLVMAMARLQSENDALTATVLAYKQREGRRGPISSIWINSTWWSGSNH